MWIITCLRLKRDRRGVSNIIVVALSLVIIVAIVANVVLWSYEMNQLDWEKMKEDVAIVNVTSTNETSSYNPSGYALGGATSLVSGDVSNLVSDDGVYMAFRSYSTDTSDFVDETCDLHPPSERGTHSNFTAQQYGPDSINDTLTEGDTAPKLNTTLLNDGFEAAVWDENWDDIAHNWQEDNSPVHSGSASAWAEYGNDGDFTCDDLNASDALSIYVDFYYYLSNTEASDLVLYYYDGSVYDEISQIGGGTEDTWLHYTEKVTDSQYFISNFRIRFYADMDFFAFEDVWVDDVLIKKEVQNDTKYELDLEVQWTGVDYDETNEYLCIYGGNMASENLKVDVWNGSQWITLITDLNATTWNNVSVSSYLTSSNFTIRFNGGNETGDTTQDSWDIDVTLLHVWSGEYTLEVEFTGSSNTEDWSQLNWTVDSAWTISSVTVTLQLYNYVIDSYSTSGDGYIAYTSDNTPSTDEKKNQTITVNPTHFRNATGYWKIKVKGVKATDTQFDFKADWIEFKVVKNPGTSFTFENEGSLTTHLVSLWVNNSTNHQRYDINVFVNSAETTTYVRADISLPIGQYTVKVVTERGNTAVYSGS